MSRDDQGLDYLAFYSHFRSPPGELKKHQERFVKYFEGGRNVLDVGCGRGEFLELLRDRGIGGVGVDVDRDMVELCRSHGLKVEQIDGVTFLERAKDGSFDGIFMDDVIEHLEPYYMYRLLSLCHDKLAVGRALVIKTINPLSLATFTDFYIDPTHRRAYDPDALRQIVIGKGFGEPAVEFLARVPDRERLRKFELSPGLGDRERRMAEIYNRNVDVLNHLLFGPEDYAVIAKNATDTKGTADTRITRA